MVHIHAEGPAFFCWIPKLFGKRVISTIHGLDWAREKWKFGVGSKFIRQGEKNAVKYADEIIVLSKDVQKYFLETYGRETHFIPNGVNRPEVREAKLITDHFGLEKDSYILFLGRLVPEKGIRYLVEAFKNVKTDKKLVIAGGSSDTDSFMEELKDLAKGDDRILFTGFVQGVMLDELYSNAYIYTLPSDLEGMPLSLLEAMSYGNCCLVSDIPECTEVVEDKPRLERCGADCKKIAFINEEVYNGLTLDDERIRQAIIEFRPRLVVIDPIQAYLGSDSDLQIAGRARKLMRRLGMWAAGYDCAIVLIGHLNKKEGSKGLYRSLGSIDVVAAARSVLQVERDTENPDIRIVHQIKNSLAPTAEDIRFSISADKGFRWLECRPQLFEKQQPDVEPKFDTEQQKAAYWIKHCIDYVSGRRQRVC